MANYLAITYITTPMQMVHIHLGTGSYTIHTLGDGRIQEGALGYYDGYLYTGQSQLPTDAIYRLQASTETLTLLGDNPGDRDCYRIAQRGSKLYWGTYSEGHIIELDTSTLALTDHGKLDPAFTAAQWCYSLAIDPAGGVAYGGLGQNPWYLAVLNLTTDAVTLYFKAADIGGTVREALDGSAVWYERRVNASTTEWYSLSGGVVTLTSEPAGPFKPYYKTSGVNMHLASWTTDENIEVDLDAANANSMSDAVIRWRAVGAETWESVTISDLTLENTVIRRAHNYDANRLLCIPAEYGTLFLYNWRTQAVSLLGDTPSSLYAAAKVGTKWYLNGYISSCLEWDPAAAWTATRTNADGTTNPRTISLDVGTYHRYAVAGNDGLLYVAASWERSQEGGELGWYNPATEAADTLRTGFELWTPRGLCAVGTDIIYSGNSIDSPAAEGLLLVFDTATKTVTKTINPLSGESISSAGYIIALGEDVVGITDTRAYRINIASEAVIWVADLPATAFDDLDATDRRAEIAPDGYIYLYCGNAIYKLDPATGGSTKVLDNPDAANVMWSDNTHGILYGREDIRTLTLT